MFLHARHKLSPICPTWTLSSSALTASASLSASPFLLPFGLLPLGERPLGDFPRLLPFLPGVSIPGGTGDGLVAGGISPRSRFSIASALPEREF